MHRFAMVLFMVLVAAVATAQIDVTISDLQQGLVEEGTLVTITDVTVTGALYNGVFVTELPVGPYAGIWVYLGNEHTALDGDVMTITGEYIEYYDLSEIDVGGSDDGAYEVTVTGGDLPEPYALDAATLYADPEPFESVAICIVDGMEVTEEPNDYGEWKAMVFESDLEIIFDDKFYDDSLVVLGECYGSACGILDYSFGNYKHLPYVDGLDIIDCTVGVEEHSFTSVKGLFQ